ncbi:flagellar biosynthesis protein FlaG [Lysinibacillus yapensis]|uniref:Flagellar biosynthesis protein FlaG n=1 Tax=Ureibacillus yapensis TaxID=2304605 RepID=A0A396SKN7_9BACL|nr:flagellar protein FlaG [Lysinibacillus yapensis]RHW39929.1 flagellar biosynthesis protein FlaG [Lysinibacillus yapensis]
MRIHSQMQIDTSSTPTTLQKSDSLSKEINAAQTHQFEQKLPKIEISSNIVDKLNEFLEVHNKNLKFVYHEGLEEYYVEIVDSQTDEVIKEIPSKELLDAYYQMQKIIGNIVDAKA